MIETWTQHDAGSWDLLPQRFSARETYLKKMLLRQHVSIRIPFKDLLRGYLKAALDAFETSAEPNEYHWDADEEQQRRNPHAWTEGETRLRNFSDQLDRFEETVRQDLRIPRTIRSAFKGFTQLSSADQQRAREIFDATNLEQELASIVDDLVIHGDRPLFRQALFTLGLGNAQGILYRSLQESATRLNKSIFLLHDQDYFGSRVRDYLPEVSDIQNSDIDPRNKHYALDRDFEELVKHPGWSSRRKRAGFKRLAADQRIREASLQANMTIAEFFSFIKAIYHESERQSPKERSHLGIEDVMNRILSAREEFLRTKLLDRTTDEAIIFYGNVASTPEVLAFDGMHFGLDPNQYRDDRGRVHLGWKYTLHAAGVVDRKIKTFGTDTRPNADEVKRSFLRAIGQSVGKTFVATDSHGLPDQLQIDNRRPNVVIDPPSIAEALIQRLTRQANPKTLEQVTLCIEACFSYDFSRKIIEDLQQKWDALPNKPFSFSDIKLPRIITTTQEMSQSKHSLKIFSVLADQEQAIAKDHGITGQRLLQSVGPLSYAYNDLTVFEGGTGLEFAEQNRQTGRGQSMSARV